MNSFCKDFVKYILNTAPRYNKEVVENDVCKRFHLTKDRKVYHNDYFAVRFCYSKSSSSSFSNTVLSLSALEKYDRIPFFVVLVRRDADNLVLLANTTFLKKISHSSQNLRIDNIKGSFNGSDIMRSYENRTNTPENFEFLFALHQGLEWKDNLSRLVDASADIKPISQKFNPTEDEERNIYNSIKRAKAFVQSENYHALEEDLNQRCESCRKEILIASHIENTNIRGRLIESLITSSDEERKMLINNLENMEKALPSYDTRNGLGDYCRRFDNGSTFTDIKTKVIYLTSNPKAYNIDKFLKQMSTSDSVFLFFFIGIDETRIFNTVLCSVYHQKLIENTLLQYHWAGRSTRGVAQFNGEAINEILNEHAFQNNIDEKTGRMFLNKLLAR